MEVKKNLRCDVCNQPIKGVGDGLLLWRSEEEGSPVGKESSFPGEPLLTVHKACHAQAKGEFPGSIPLEDVASGKAKPAINILAWEGEVHRLHLVRTLKAAFNNFPEREFFDFTLEDYEKHHRL